MGGITYYDKYVNKTYHLFTKHYHFPTDDDYN